MMIRAEMGSVKKRSEHDSETWVFAAAIRMQPGNRVSQCEHEHPTHDEALACAQTVLLSVVEEMTGIAGITASDGELSLKKWADQGMIGVPTFFNIMDMHPGANIMMTSRQG